MADFKAGTAELDITPGFKSFGTALLAGVVKPVKDAGDAATSALTKSFQSGFGTIGTLAKAAYAGIGIAALAGLQGAVNETVELANETRTMSMQLGITAEAASGLNYALTKLGVPISSALAGFGIFEKNLEQGGKSFQQYGIAIDETLPPQEQFNRALEDAADKYVALGGGVESTTFALNAFGRGGKAIIPFLAQGSAGIRELEAEASKLGLTLSQSDLIAARQYTIAQQEMNDAINGLQVSIGRSVVPLETTFFHALTDVITLLEKIPGPVKTGLLAFVGLTGAMVGLQLVLGLIKSAWAPLTEAILANASANTVDTVAVVALGEAEGTASVGIAAMAAATAATLGPMVAFAAAAYAAYGAVKVFQGQGVNPWRKALGDALPVVIQTAIANGQLTGSLKPDTLAMLQNTEATSANTLAKLANRSATESLAGGLIGVESAILGTTQATQGLKAAEQTYAKDLKDTHTPLSQLHADELAVQEARLGSLQSQLSLRQAVTSYAEQLNGPVKAAYENLQKVEGDSKHTTQQLQDAQQQLADAQAAVAPEQQKAIALIRDLGVKAGLSKAQIATLIGQVTKYTGVVKGVPPAVTTKFGTDGLGAATSAAATYVGWLNKIDGTYTPTVIFPGGGAHPFAAGGEITEPILGVGLRTGERYTFGEEGPETVVPHGTGPGGRGGGGQSVGPITFVGARGTPAEFVRELDWYVKSGGLG